MGPVSPTESTILSSEKMQKEFLDGNISSGTTERVSEWVELDPKSGEQIMMVQPVGSKELRVGPCSLTKTK